MSQQSGGLWDRFRNALSSEDVEEATENDDDGFAWLDDEELAAGEGDSEGADADESDADANGEFEFDGDVEELRYDIESLEDAVEDNGNRLDTVDDGQTALVDRMDDVDDTVRRLVGVYDAVTDDANPFTGEGEDADGFDMFGDRESQPIEIEGVGDAATESEDEDTVSFDDLKESVEADDAAESETDPENETVDESRTHAVTESEDDEDVTLERLPATYAADIVVFEWLADLVRTAGPAATLRAIAYYHEVGWISPEVRDHLEGVLGGPDLDIQFDPGATPDELTAADHADSYTRIMTIRTIHEGADDPEASEATHE